MSWPEESDAVGGVRNPLRLAAVARAELHGHLGDPDLNSIVATLRIACRVPIAVINIVEQNRQTYPAEVGVGAPCTTVPDQLSFCAEVVETKRTLAVSDATAHPIYADNPMVRTGVVAAYAGVPLVDAGYVLGSVSIFDGRPRVFTPDELEVLHHQARLASSVLALRRTARTDVLTGLPNRQMLFDRLEVVLARIGRNESVAAVMYLDLDGFKALNDSRGHDAGDRLLADLALRWTAALRSHDTLARVGGDEFVVVCEDMASIRQTPAPHRRSPHLGRTRIATRRSRPPPGDCGASGSRLEFHSASPRQRRCCKQPTLRCTARRRATDQPEWSHEYLVGRPRLRADTGEGSSSQAADVGPSSTVTPVDPVVSPATAHGRVSEVEVIAANQRNGPTPTIRFAAQLPSSGELIHSCVVAEGHPCCG